MFSSKISAEHLSTYGISNKKFCAGNPRSNNKIFDKSILKAIQDYSINTGIISVLDRVKTLWKKRMVVHKTQCYVGPMIGWLYGGLRPL